MSQRKIEKGVFEMTNGIGKIGGGGYEGLNPYFKRDKNVEGEQVAAQPNIVPETKDVNPDEVLNFIAGTGNIFVQNQKPEFTPVKLPDGAEERIAGYMASFEATYKVAAEEFGEEIALQVMDLM